MFRGGGGQGWEVVGCIFFPKWNIDALFLGIAPFSFSQIFTWISGCISSLSFSEIAQTVWHNYPYPPGNAPHDRLNPCLGQRATRELKPSKQLFRHFLSPSSQADTRALKRLKLWKKCVTLSYTRNMLTVRLYSKASLYSVAMIPSSYAVAQTHYFSSPGNKKWYGRTWLTLLSLFTAPSLILTHFQHYFCQCCHSSVQVILC